MSFPSPNEVRQRQASIAIERGIQSALAQAERVLQQKYRDSSNPIEIEFHSTPFEAVEVVVQQLRSSGWIVLSTRINRGYFSHYITVKNGR